jgi:hypothetical protein
VKVSVAVLGADLSDEISAIGGAVAQGINARVKKVAEDSRKKASMWADTRLSRTKQQYQNALSVKQVEPGVWAVILDADAAHLETGYGSFDMKPGLLHLGKDIPGNSNIKVSKSGFRYRAIPFDHSQAPANDEHPLHNAVVQKGQEQQTTMGSLADDLKMVLKQTGLNKTSRDANGNPIIGKVATVTPGKGFGDVIVKRFGPGGGSTKTDLDVVGETSIPNILDPRLAGLTKYQFQPQGSKKVRTAYVTFRIVSEKQTGKWIHPGIDGARIFPDLAQWAERTLVEEIEKYLRDSG